MDNNSIIVKEENFFKKMINKIKNAFSKNKEVNNAQEEDNTENTKKKSFFGRLKADVDPEIYELKMKLDRGEAKAIELTDEQIEKLQVIYNKEIEEKMKKLDRLRKNKKN